MGLGVNFKVAGEGLRSGYGWGVFLILRLCVPEVRRYGGMEVWRGGWEGSG